MCLNVTSIKNCESRKKFTGVIKIISKVGECSNLSSDPSAKLVENPWSRRNNVARRTIENSSVVTAG